MEFPLRLDQINEVLVSLNLRAHSSIVIIPLSLSNGAVLVFISEALQELGEDLIKADLTRDNLGVL